MLATAILHACGTGTTSAVNGGGGGNPPALPLDMGPILAYGFAALILGAAIVALVTVFALTRAQSPGPKPVPVPVGATLSPDGYYWWDGAAWRPVR
jgi:hypothetical protein